MTGPSPEELQNLTNLNRIDQVAGIRRQYEQIIAADQFACEADRAAAHRNLEMLKLYSLQQDLR